MILWKKEFIIVGTILSEIYQIKLKDFDMRLWIVVIFISVLTSCKWQSKQTDSKIDQSTLVRDTLIAVITDTIETRFIAGNKPLWTPTKAQFSAR